MSGRPKDKGQSSSGGWTEVNRRQRKFNNRWDNILETTFFVENLPEEASNNVLWRLFGKVGRLSDAYVAKKKDSTGNKLGFLRFLNVKDTNEILEKANEVRVLEGVEAVVKISLARFDRNPPRKQGTNQSFNPKDVEGVSLNAGRRFYSGGMSYKEVVNNHSSYSNPARKAIRLSGEEGLLQKHWIGKADIGEGKGTESLEKVQKVLGELGLQDVGLSYVGGLKMLVTFHDKKQELDFINNRRQTWGVKFLNQQDYGMGKI